MGAAQKATAFACRPKKAGHVSGSLPSWMSECHVTISSSNREIPVQKCSLKPFGLRLRLTCESHSLLSRVTSTFEFHCGAHIGSVWLVLGFPLPILAFPFLHLVSVLGDSGLAI